MTNINSIREQDDNSSPRGRSLENDFKRLINDERFHDIALKCSDGMIYGCKAILATRSDVFNSSIFNKSTNCDNTLSFDDINKTAMRVILKFLYTSKVENMLDADNVIEVYYASIHFDLIDLQDHIIEFIQSLINEEVDIGKKLLSECVRKFSLEVDNKVSHILVKCVAKNKLEKRDKDSLSLEGLRYLLKKTFDTRIPFATSEFNIWEYSLMKAIRKVVRNDTLVEKILDESSFSTCEPQVIEEIKNHMTTLIDYINLNRMDVEEIRHVEPFNIHTIEKLKDVYRSIAENKESGFIRGIPVFRWRNDNIDNMANVYNDGFTVETVMLSAPVLRNFRDREVTEVIGPFVQPKSILGDLIFKGRGVYEWNILIEKMYKHIYIGICDIHENLNNNFSFTNFSFNYRHGWVLGSDGYVYHENNYKWYDAKFKEGDKVTVHLDMKNRTCAFSINNIRKLVVSEWRNIPSQVYPIVSLGHGSKVTITY